MGDHFLCLGESFGCFRWCTDEGSIGVGMALELVILPGLRLVRIGDACMVTHLHLCLDVGVIDLACTVLAAKATLTVCTL